MYIYTYIYIVHNYYTSYASLVYKLGVINAVCRLVIGSKKVCRD